jgi:hypothetical protein
MLMPVLDAQEAGAVKAVVSAPMLAMAGWECLDGLSFSRDEAG